MKKLSNTELIEIEGGWWGAPPDWAIDAAIATGKSVEAWWEGFKSNSVLFEQIQGK